MDTPTSAAAPLPHLRRRGSAHQLIVDGEPFLIRGGELGNSSAERTYLRGLWPRFAELGLNTVLAPVSWDVVEPAEGTFDWALLDHLLEDARAHSLRLVLLWFGSWKNSMSCYAPAWVKADTDRFPRCRDSRGHALEVLSPFERPGAPGGNEARDADARAFAALMRRLRETDPEHTVLMVQVENEIGMIPEARDHSEAAERAWSGPVPPTLAPLLGRRPEDVGAWADVSGGGPQVEEMFQAWAFARYVEAVAAAGKRELALPLYTNAALVRPGAVPGQYPSAGPLPHLAAIWRAGAPSLDFLAPDIYFPTFAQWAAAYVDAGFPLFVPEALRSVEAAANALYAFGAHGAIGFSPFGIESIDALPGALLAGAFGVVRQLTPLIAAHTADGSMAGLLPPSDDMRGPHRVHLACDGEGGDGLVLSATYERVTRPSLADGVINEAGDLGRDPTRLPAAAIAIRTAPDELVVGGSGVTLTFAEGDRTQSPPGPATVGILSCEEGAFDDTGAWQHLRWLNGDQTHQGRHVRLEPGRFAIQRVRLYRYR